MYLWEKYAYVISFKSINYETLEIKSILGRKSAILEKGNRTKTAMMFENYYHTPNHLFKSFLF